MIIEPHQVHKDIEASADVCVIGSGAGGGVAAAKLAEAGLKVICLEAGGYYTSKDFDMTEKNMMPKLYAEKGLRTSRDLSLVILAGSNVGGGTTVNWTLCFRTPDHVLEEWQSDFKLGGCSPADMAPSFDEVEKNISAKKTGEPHHNWNNRSLLIGGKKLGAHAYSAKRNTDGCQQSGLCGYGCPFDAKKGTLLTYIPRAMKAGADLYSNCRVGKIVHKNGVFSHVTGTISDKESGAPKHSIKVKAKVLVLAAGALDSAALLLRSNIPNDNDVLGSRFFCHPTVGLVSNYDHPVHVTYGIPQSTTVDFHNIDDQGSGYKLEAAPAFPGLAGLAGPKYGVWHKKFMAVYPYQAVHIVLTRDRTPHVRIGVRDNGLPAVDYYLSDVEKRTIRHGLKNLAKLNFEAGATHAYTLHSVPTIIKSPKDLSKIDELPLGENEHMLFTAHQMATCPMGDDKKITVVNSEGESHEIKNLFIFDGSVFPNSPGVNPMLSIMGFSTHLSNHLISNRVKYFSS